MTNLFEDDTAPQIPEKLEEGAVLLHGFARADVAVLIDEVERIARTAPFRNLTTPGGYRMSVAMTNCGKVGWVSDRSGYRYDRLDPETGIPWSPMPLSFVGLAVRAAAAAGFSNYDPDACLINRYIAGSRLGLHRDQDEEDSWAPIVSVSLGRPAVFLWGGKRRADPVRRIRLESGDVAVWGGPARFIYHGIAPLKDGHDSLAEVTRINLTFRKVFRA